MSIEVHTPSTPFILPSHLLRTSSYMNFFRIQCNFILFNKYTHFFFYFSFIFINFFFVFRVVPECSGMFRNVPECSMFLVLSTAVGFANSTDFLCFVCFEVELIL